MLTHELQRFSTRADTKLGADIETIDKKVSDSCSMHSMRVADVCTRHTFIHMHGKDDNFM
jgi:hypothetical protein